MFQLSSQKDDLGSSSCPRPAVKSLHVSIWDSPLISFTSFDLGQCFCPLPVLMLLSYLHTRLPLHLPAMLLQSALLYKCSVPDIKPRRKKSSISTQIYDYVAITIANRPRTLFIRCVWARDYVCVCACVCPSDLFVNSWWHSVHDVFDWGRIGQKESDIIFEMNHCGCFCCVNISYCVTFLFFLLFWACLLKV